MTKIDLASQVQNILPPLHGGTGNAKGAATEQVIMPFVNDSGGTLTVGTVVTRSSSDPKLHGTTVAGEKVVGVVVGHYSTTTGLFSEASVAADETAAVCVVGRCNVRTDSSAARGQYLAAGTSAGQAAVSTTKPLGAFGYVLYNISSSLAQAIIGAMEAGGVTVDHGATTGLSDDDHPQYVLRDSLTWRVPMVDQFHRAAVTVDSTFGTDVGSQAVDGTTLWWAAASAGFPHWLYVDLLSAHTIRAFRAVFRASDPTQRFVDFLFQSSPDHSAWTTRATITGNTSDDLTVVLASASQVSARYWRIYVTAGNGSTTPALEEFHGYSTLAEGIPITDVGGYYTTDTVEAALQQLGPVASGEGFVTVTGGGKETLSIVAATGATETVDLADGNVHDLTLDADCTLTLTGATVGVACGLTLILRQDGTGGWDATWPGSVVWPGGVTPTLSSAPDAVSVFTLFTLDGGTTWYGFHGSNEVVPDPATTVTDETAWAIAPAVGTDLEYARQDHTHGTPAEPVVPTGLGGDHVHVVDEQFNGDAATTVFPLANEAVPDSVMAWVAGARTPVTLGGAFNDEITFGAAPGSGTNNISVDYAAVLA